MCQFSFSRRVTTSPIMIKVGALISEPSIKPGIVSRVPVITFWSLLVPFETNAIGVSLAMPWEIKFEQIWLSPVSPI